MRKWDVRARDALYTEWTDRKSPRIFLTIARIRRNGRKMH
jgi:hypothetical protein